MSQPTLTELLTPTESNVVCAELIERNAADLPDLVARGELRTALKRLQRVLAIGTVLQAVLEFDAEQERARQTAGSTR